MEAPPSTPPPTSKISTRSIHRAVKSLLKWQKSTSNRNHNPNPRSQSQNNEFLYLVLTLNKTPQNFRPQNPYKIPLPNPLTSPHSPSFKICLLVPDKHSLSSKHKIEQELLPISNVIKLSKLRSHYNSFDLKKNLCDSFDLFVTDKRVVPTLEKYLGRVFSKRKKTPVPLELGRPDWLAQLEAACSSAELNLSKSGSCSVVRVASGAADIANIVENVEAAVNGIAQVVPKKWRNVKSFHLKFPESLALPIYEMKVENDGREVGEKRKKSDEEIKEKKSKKSKILD